MTLIDIMRESAFPMEPVPTGYPVRAAPIGEIECVLFDIYGTLIISETGDVGSGLAAQAGGADSVAGTLGAALGALLREYRVSLGARELAAAFAEEVRAAHARALPDEGFPEVDAQELWASILGLGADEALLFSAAWEASCNRVWPMPGAAGMLEELRAAGLRLGIVSNAQAYTPPLFPILLGKTIEDFGFDPELCFFSWRERRGKPSPRLFASLSASLARCGIAPERTLFVGNDMLKDMYPARRAGLKTCLFAGDARSLKTRDDDPRCAFESDAAIDRLDLLGAVLGRPALLERRGGREGVNNDR